MKVKKPDNSISKVVVEKLGREFDRETYIQGTGRGIIKTITTFETTDGEEFEDYDEATKHQVLLDMINVISFYTEAEDKYEWNEEKYPGKIELEDKVLVSDLLDSVKEYFKELGKVLGYKVVSIMEE